MHAMDDIASALGAYERKIMERVADMHRDEALLMMVEKYGMPKERANELLDEREAAD